MSQRTSSVSVGENADMIRGLGVYHPDAVVAHVESAPWEETEPPPTEARLRELVGEISDSPHSFLWIGLFEPTLGELAMVETVFGIPRLQIEDAANAMQRPKMELDVDGRGFVLVKTLDYVDASSDVTTGQVAVFVGPQYVVTVRAGRVGDLTAVRRRLLEQPELRTHGPVCVLYAVLDMVVDGYLTVSDEIGLDIEQVETEVFSDSQTPQTAKGIYRLKRENVEIRRAVAPLVSVAHEFAAERVEWVPVPLRPYFQDIGEHLLRASETVEASDNLLMTMLMASTSRQDLQQNRDMRKISAWVAIAAVPTMIAGIYGMNFDFMPELHQPWGYPLILVVMGGSCVAMYRAFKRSGWL
jgi:magnesium transporter